MPDCFRFSKNIKSQQPGDVAERQATVSDSQRTSNHNARAERDAGSALFPILKEHQITTSPTTTNRRPYCFRFSKNIKSQRSTRMATPNRTVSDSQRTSNHNLTPQRCRIVQLFPILKEHQITTIIAWPRVLLNCFRFSKNIKSQRHSVEGFLGCTVSDSQRTSNHNSNPQIFALRRLFPILKEHQITTSDR